MFKDSKGWQITTYITTAALALMSGVGWISADQQGAVLEFLPKTLLCS